MSVDQHVEELTFDPLIDKAPLLARFSGPSGFNMTQAKHTIFRVELTPEKMFAVDLTSAQYGYFKPVVEWNEYAKRIRNENAMRNFEIGFHLDSLPLILQLQVARMMDSAWMRWEQTKIDIVELPKDQFDERQKEFVECLETEIQKSVEYLEEDLRKRVNGDFMDGFQQPWVQERVREWEQYQQDNLG